MGSRERRSEQRTGWIFGLVLIVVGSVFLLQNWGLPVLIANWWAPFILIPAIGALTAAWTVYRQNGQFTPRVGRLVTGGLGTLTIALIFLFNFDFGSTCPWLPVVLGAGMLLRSGTPTRADRRAEVG